jgi:hypothetical protein
MRYLIFIMGLFTLTACSSGSKLPTPPNTVATSSESTPDPHHAKIEAIEVIRGGSYPLQYSAAVILNFSGQCKQVSEITQDFEDATFKIDIITEEQTACQPPLGLMEQIIPLDMLNLPAGVYHIVVNGVNKSFELPTDNKL